jgi:hypothetical protein
MRFLMLLTIAAALCSAPATAEQDIVIFLHNAWFEKNKGGEAHQKFGAYDFEGIKTALGGGGQVLALQRGPGADPRMAADELVQQIETLIASGHKPESIKVIGASKGALIAQLASEKLNQPRIRWVLIGGCHNALVAKGDVPKMTGKVLSIYETTDTVAGSCKSYGDLVDRTETFEEVAISTGNDHGFQFGADQAWISPALSW